MGYLLCYSTLFQNQIDDPATADVRAGAAAVVENLRVGAAGFLQSVGKDRHDVVAAVVVDGLGQLGDGAVVPGEPSGIDGRGAEGIAEDVAKKIGLHLLLGNV